MLSNTAVPKYYGEFRERVLSGEIPVNRFIAQEMHRIDELIANPKYYYSEEKVEGYIRFCEEELTLTDGGDLKLLDTFKLWAEQVFGWWYFVERSVYEQSKDGHGGRYVRKRFLKRLTQKQFLVVARGGAKSMYGCTIHAYYLVVDTSTTHQVTTAPTMKQAEEMISPFKTAITRSRGPLFQFLTEGSLQNTTGSAVNRKKLSSTKKGVENFLTNSLLEVRPMSIDKVQGLRAKVCTVDEWLSGDIREDIIGALEQGASKGGIADYLIIGISSEGTVRNGAGDDVKIELEKILRGEFYAPHVSIWMYRLDDVTEVADPRMWQKAQPNIGLTVSYETYAEDVDRAEAVPAARNDILAKRFGLPMEGYTYFFTYEETLPHTGRHDYWGLPCALGADLSKGDDFCAFTFLFPLNNGTYGVKTMSYISENTLKKLTPAARIKYDEFLEEGTLRVMEGVTLNMEQVYEDLMDHVDENDYDIRAFGYDPYNAKTFVEKYESDFGPYAVTKVVQGARTESVPLGELKDLAELRYLIFDEKLMSFSMGHAVVQEDTNGNRKLIKLRAEEKIDNFSALMDAYIAFNQNKEAFE